MNGPAGSDSDPGSAASSASSISGASAGVATGASGTNPPRSAAGEGMRRRRGRARSTPIGLWRRWRRMITTAMRPQATVIATNSTSIVSTGSPSSDEVLTDRVSVPVLCAAAPVAPAPSSAMTKAVAASTGAGTRLRIMVDRL